MTDSGKRNQAMSRTKSELGPQKIQIKGDIIKGVQKNQFQDDVKFFVDRFEKSYKAV